MPKKWLVIGAFGIALISSADCSGKSGSSTSPSGGGGGGSTATFVADPGGRFTGAQPAPVVVNGVVYVYVSTGTDGTNVEASSDGLNFSVTAATYPAGFSRTIVNLPDGRFRMYYFPDGTSVDVLSAISSDGLNWTAEGGVRFSEPAIGGVRATALPTGGYRLYYVTSIGISSAMSSDGLTFAPEGPVTLPPDNSTFSWGPSAVASVGGRFHMVLTKTLASANAELWHAVSSDGRNWTVDTNVFAKNGGQSLTQPAWCINGSVVRIYYRAQPPTNAIASGIVKF